MNKILRLITFLLILCIALITGCSKGTSRKSTNTINSLKFEDIKSVKLELGTTGGNPSKNYTFDFNDSEQTKIVKDIVSYLNSGKVQGDAEERVTNKGNSPTLLILEFKDGSTIQIKSAVGSEVKKLSNGSTEISQFNIPNEVTISKNSNEKPFRILSTELRNLIDSGYKDIFKSTIKNNIDNNTFDETKAISMALKEHPDFPSSQSDTITIEPTGGNYNATENVKFTTKVEKVKESTYEVTLTKDWGISVNGKYAKSSWKYKVTPNSVTSLEIIDNDYLIKQIK